MFRYLCVMILFVTVTSTQAQPKTDPKAEALLRGAVERLQAAESVQADATATLLMRMGQHAVEDKYQYLIAARHPNQFGRFTANQGMLIESLVSDGTNLFEFFARYDAYEQRPAPDTLEELFKEDPVAMATMIGPLMLPGAYDNVIVQGAKDIRYKGTRSEAGEEFHVVTLDDPARNREFLLTMAEPPTIRRITIQSKEEKAAPMTLDFRNWQIDEPVEPMLLSFKPNSTMQKVDSVRELAAAVAEGRSLLLGKDAPDFTLPRADGGEVTLSDHEGKDIVILDFWAAWCGPCLRSMPEIIQVAEEFKDQNVVMYAINLRDEPEDMEPFLSALAERPTVLMDKKALTGRIYEAAHIPRTVIIDKQGIVQSVHRGYRPGETQDQLRSEIQQLVEGKSLVAPKE